MLVKIIKRAVWLIIAPFFILLALAYIHLSMRKSDVLSSYIVPFGIVLLLIFLTDKTQDMKAVA
jgi:hypothetical protein